MEYRPHVYRASSGAPSAPPVPCAPRGYPRAVFTGLVQALGSVRAIRPGPQATRLEISLGDWAHRPAAGDSIAVNGCCLTVAAAGDGDSGRSDASAAGSAGAHPAWAGFDVIPQTLAVTALGALRVGEPVNLEHAATPTTFLGGHVVLGHVDGLAEIVGLETTGEWRVRLLLPGDLGCHAVDMGSIALDGVSLTIARVEDTPRGTTIDVCLIPETLARTNLRSRAVGDRVHVEADYLGKLVARQLAWMKGR